MEFSSHFRKIDFIIVILVFITGFSVSYIGSGHVSPEGSRASNVWFQADIGRVYGNMSSRQSNHYRTKVHPLFSIATGPVVHAIHKVTALDKSIIVRYYIAVIAGLWLSLFFSILRLLSLPKLDAVIFTALVMNTSSAIFWTSVSETFLFGSVTILAVLVLLAYDKKNKLSSYWYIVFSAMSLSMTVTNWMAGLLATKSRYSWQKALQYSLSAFAIVTLLWLVQRVIYPSAEYFLFSKEETAYLLLDEAGGFIERCRAFFYHSVIMPSVLILDNPWAPEWPRLSVQFAAIETSTIFTISLIIGWTGLFLFGAWSSLTKLDNSKFKWVLWGVLLGQLGLHLVYGDETFLYAMHWASLLIIVAALGCLSSYRYYVLFVTLLLSMGLSINNIKQFDRATGTLVADAKLANLDERSILLDQINKFPDIDWPRSEGHVLLANSESPLAGKGYHEPGGSFSPGFRTFGISVVLFDKAGKFVTSSNSIPLSEVTQSINVGEAALETNTPYYKMSWSLLNDGRYQLKFRSKDKSQIAVLRITSAGPAGGPINDMFWQKDNFVVNNKYYLNFNTAPRKILFGDELVEPVFDEHQLNLSPVIRNGFASAFLLLDNDIDYMVHVENKEVSSSERYSIVNDIKVDLENAPHFEKSLHAQIFHLRAGNVSLSLRPGDPGNYDVNWLRDGVYSLVALSRSGNLMLAKALAEHYAIHDFFGGFGAEADAPGLAIWALDEVSVRLDDSNYDKWLWPHIIRKVELIDEMLSASGKVYKPFSGAVVPSLRDKEYNYLSMISHGLKSGLIVGKMDNHFPILYVNAVSYLGYRRAALLALRLGYIDEAEQWQRKAKKLQTAWLDYFSKLAIEEQNIRTFISGLWPTMVADKNLPMFKSIMNYQYQPEKALVSNPKWTYFNIAQAHQWLIMNEPEKVWNTLDWFWDNQASPGLYTWWEGDSEENSFRLWEGARGWFKPKHVTPHYWTAAEVLLLQLDMLAFERVVGGRSVITLGIGLTPKQLADEIKVQGLVMRKGVLDWTWDGEKVLVKWRGTQRVDIQLSKSFPSNTVVNLVSNNYD